MLPTMTSRQRCTECRRWYHPAASAKGSQLVCSEACRKARRSKLARRRRWERLEESRRSERARQRDCRSRKRAPGTVGVRAGPGEEAHDVTPCHAPPSARKTVELREKFALFWNKQARRSRATLDRELQRIAQETRDFVDRSLTEIETSRGAVTRHPPS